MPLYECQTPDGYKNTEEAWLSPDATLQRISFAIALGRGSLPVGAEPGLAATEAGRRPVPSASVDPGRLKEIFGSTLSSAAREVVDAATPGLRASLILGSPDFMRR
jgi:hypothetical protein